MLWVASGDHLSHGRVVRLSVRTGAVQVAPLAPSADREAADYLGVQDPIPGCSVSVGCGQDHFCGCRPGKAQESNTFSPRVTSIMVALKKTQQTLFHCHS